MSVVRWAFQSFFAAYQWIDSRLTIGGKTCAIVLLICCIPVLQSTASVTPLFAVFFALMLVSAVANFAFWPRVTVKVTAVPTVNCGDEILANISVTNQHWLAAYDLDVELLPDLRIWQVSPRIHHAMEIERGESGCFGATLRPRRRGVFGWPGFAVTTTFPFHLIRAASVVDPRGEL